MRTSSLLNKKLRSAFVPSFSFICDPLEQFEVTPVLTRLSSFGTNLAFTWRALLIVRVIALSSFSKTNFSKYDYLTSSLYFLVKAIVQENLYIQKQQYFTVRFYLFSTLLIANLIGLLPFAFTVTSSFGVTFFLALTHFVGVNLVGATSHKWHLSNLFLPAGVPLAITPFLVLIEAVSYLARVLSLSIRLFANRRSGHALLKILIGFSLIRGSSTVLLLNFLAVVPWAIVTGVRFLELLIAFLQAYVFTILVTLYVNDNLTLH